MLAYRKETYLVKKGLALDLMLDMKRYYESNTFSLASK